MSSSTSSEEGSLPSDYSRPALARSSISTHATTERPTSILSSHGDIYASWEQSDIRSDLASGWGGDTSSVGMMGGSLDRGNRATAAFARNNNDNTNNNHDAMDEDDGWTWRLRDQAVHPVPSFYPMEPRSTRRLYLADRRGGDKMMGGMKHPGDLVDEDATFHSVEEISQRISTACQSLSIQGFWDNACPSATLCSMERVEMEINLYLGDATTAPSSYQSSPQVLLVELQRRKGCNITFHKYRRCLLDAAEGKFDPESFHQTDGLDKPSGRDRCNQPRASLGRPGLARPSPSGGGRPSMLARPSLAKPSPSGGLARPSLRSPSFSADDAAMPIAGLKTEGEESSPRSKGEPGDIFDKAMKALTMAASLIRKDRFDARRLGMESLVLLTDPLRAGMETAKVASRVVLLGSGREEMVWEANDVAVGSGQDDDVDALFDESAGLGIRERILEMIMAGSEEEKTSEEDGFEGIEKDFTDSLFNLCLIVMSNALHTIEGSAKASPDAAQDDNSDDGDRKPSPRRRAATEPAVRPSVDNGVSKRFIDDTNSTFGCDVLSSLIRILGQAKSNPHDAYHSARCLGVLFKGCGNSHKARARRDLDAKRIISAALEVGSRSHAKLADASRVAMVALVTDDEESMEEEEEAGETTELESPIVREETMTEEGQQQQQQHCELPSVLEQSQSSESDER
eukprot:CAMPEP_0172310878 /NCGR_PEP_ID=MMETSP1058-20130122/12901_1 /TAXON_ID=83371 /ORGANISM="Detonula confervacea, Strain CCMP 353" /LENGTH=684 /DNA_ID=CAMNT_0013023855 /DNA_START=638 /DNA_END=2692 /DNA_ORIENTATION=-